MIQLTTCTRCRGFLALALRACPHCDAPVARLQQIAFGIAGLVGGGAVSMTLMACYGPACVDDACTDEGARPISSGEIQQLQESLGAGTFTGVSAGAPDRSCTMTVTGSIEEPRSLRIELVSMGGDVSGALELRADETEVGSVSVSGDDIYVQPLTGSSFDARRQGEGFDNVSLGGAVCKDLTRR